MARSSLQLGTYFGQYYLVKLIAIGGMAEIYLASTKGVGGFEKQLALKVIHADFADDDRFVQMLVDEAKIAVKLNHPNIAQTFDLGRIDNCYFISMEFVDGADFFQLLKRTAELKQEFPLPAALIAIHEALCGLDYAHKKCDDDGTPLKIIHRDISPQNILISRHGEAKIVDFGIAKAANLSTKTRAGMIKGKLVYMSPEQSWGDQLDHRSDIFSAGIVLYEALTGGSLYREKNAVRLLEMVRKAEISPPSSRRREIPAELDALVMRALNPDRERRYPTAGDFADAIAAFLRRYAPGYTTAHLGEQLCAVLAGQKPSAAAAPPPPSMAMQRADFAVPQDSVIFSAEDMMESQPPSMPPRGTGQRVGRPTLMAPPKARLVLLEETGDTPYPLGDNFIIGRAGDLRLGDARVSRRHARITVEGGAHILEDMNSSNGTFLNETKLSGAHQLQPGDVIRVGPFHIRYELEALSRGAGGEEHYDTPHEQGADEYSSAQPPRPEEEDSGSLDAVRLAEAEASRGAEVSSVAAQTAELRLRLGDELLSLPVGEQLPLGHTLELGDRQVQGAAAILVLREGSYWLDPVEGQPPLQVNGRTVRSATQLSPGDTLTVGPLELTLIYGT